MTNQNASPSKFAQSVAYVFGILIGTLIVNSVNSLVIWLILKYLIQYSVAWSVVFGFCLLLDISVKAIKSTWNLNVQTIKETRPQQEDN